MDQSEPQRFRLGITMAGAISAGAYSGGVFDMIFEVLDAWEMKKKEEQGQSPGRRTVPVHQVVVPVVSGASAGSITGALGLVALADVAPSAKPMPPPTIPPGVGTVETRLPRLYAAWVTRPRFVDAAPAPFLLGQDDLDGPVASLLDTTLLDHVARDALAGIQHTYRRAYLANPLRLFLTVTNLQGLPYALDFDGEGGARPYVMICHADRVHFALAGLGCASDESRWACPDPAQKLDVTKLENHPAPHNSPEWSAYLSATLASGAFPIGLRAQKLPPLPHADLAKRQWPIRSGRTGSNRFRLASAWRGIGDSPIPRGAVDGGVIDNEPFELARWALMADPPEPNPRDIRKADRAVLMIDPFPSEPVENPADPDRFLLDVLRRFIPLLVGQARFKLDAIVAALDPAIGSRFLISPRRYTKRVDGSWNELSEPHGIACGLMGGFGGFLSESFRAHDYQLGRLNAYRFLKRHFCFPCDNAVIEQGYAGFDSLDRFRGADANLAGEPDARRYQMIPVLDSVTEPEAPDWPRVSLREVDEFAAIASKRADALVRKLMTEKLRGWPMRLGARFAWWQWGRDGAAEAIRYSVLKELHLRDQLDGPTAGLDEAARKVLAALCDIDYAARTPAGIDVEYHVPEERVRALLQDPGPVGQLVERGPTAGSWRLRARRPGRFSRLFSGPPQIG